MRHELRASSLGVDVAGRVLLNDITFTVASGEMLVITGASGSGKSTLARILAGVSAPDRGAVTFDGAPRGAMGEFSQRPAFVPQDFGLVSVLTAHETISLPLQGRSLSREEIRERCATWLEALGLQSCAARPVSDLSGGQRQRVAIARALALRAEVIVMDEPTAELDPANRALLLSLLEEERARGALLLAVSHDSDVIARADSLFEVPPRR
jgi:ABC-type multidrug transport system ATPase subunit